MSEEGTQVRGHLRGGRALLPSSPDEIALWPVERKNEVLEATAKRVACPRCDRQGLVGYELRYRKDGLFQPSCLVCGEEVSPREMLRIFAKGRSLENTTASSLAFIKAFEVAISRGN